MKISLINHPIVLAIATALVAPHFGAAAPVTGDPLTIGTSQTLTGTGSSIAGGTLHTNLANYSTIAGGEANAIWATGNDYKDDFIGGGYQNVMDDEVNTSVIGGGSVNGIWDECYLCVIAGGQANVITNSPYCVIGGGVGNVITDNGVNGYGAILSGQGNVLQYVDNSVIAGGAANMIGPGQYNAIGGGARNTNWANTHGTIAGGIGNTLGLFAGGSFIGGGEFNLISTNCGDGVICGGAYNLIDTNCPNATVGGGFNNRILANCQNSVILGGQWNTVAASNAVVCGGFLNSAVGTNSFAGGYYGIAFDDGCFVWADSSPASPPWVGSSAPNQFIVRAAGGVYFGNGGGHISIPSTHYIETSTGAYLTTAGCWSTCSDRNLKTNFTPINSAEVLRKVIELPISSWGYKAEDRSVRHIGPVAQDFYTAFALGQDDRHIVDIDEGGVALAAIQGLNQKLKEKDATMAELKKQLSALQEQFASLQKQMAAQKELSSK